MERRRVTFRGRVQGVGFRAASASIADGFEITGWVRNEPDGSVLMEVQGGPTAIERFLKGVREELGRYIQSEAADSCPVVSGEGSFAIRR